MIASYITRSTLFAAIITLVGGQAVLFPSQSEFAASEAPGLPSFSVRANNVTAAVCNSSTPGVSGFIDTPEDDSHVFFWLFESKNDFSRDPIILFMSGCVISWILVKSNITD